jgi:hypothetical protein
VAGIRHSGLPHLRNQSSDVRGPVISHRGPPFLIAVDWRWERTQPWASCSLVSYAPAWPSPLPRLPMRAVALAVLSPLT